MAAVNEFTRTPFIREAVRATNPEVRRILRKGWSEAKKLNEIGRVVRSVMEKRIQGADLVDTAEMLKSVEFDVVLRR